MSDPSVVRAVVVDDEPAARDVVVTLLAEHPTVEVIGEATNGREAVELVRRLRPDLLFLDIQMPDQDGFGVLEALGDDVPRGIVFVTAHDEHATRAFEVHALDYVLKPFGRPRFRAAVTRALERLSALDALTLQRTLASIAADRRASGAPAGELSIGGQRGKERDDGGRYAPPRRLGVRVGSRIVIVDVDTIDWVEASGDYARIHAGRQTHFVAQRMHAFERMLENGEFIRIHRSLIVNLKRVRELHRDADGGGTIILADGVRLRVARGRWEALQEALRIEEC
ncbi:MAG: LytR/AlgR family response regulator transcription factor [Gemmatimonadaceae bacterium]